MNFIVCGLEHSGTTLISDILRAVPGCDSGFECGVFLVEKPIQFLSLSPYCKNILEGWKISADDLNYCCEVENHTLFFDRLYERSGLFLDNGQPKIRFDKTPRYISSIENVLQRSSLPAVAMIRDPRGIAWSDFTRSKRTIDEVDDWYLEWMPSKRNYMRSAYAGYEFCWANSDLCHVIRLEDLCFRSLETIIKLDNFLSLPFSYGQFFLEDKRYAHTKGKSIDISIAVEHLSSLPSRISQMVVEDFAEFENWFFDF